VQKTGYQDWSNRISVSLGTRTDVYATLSPEITDTTLVTTIQTATLLKTTTTQKSTAKVPTPWPSPSATTTPIEIVVIPGAVVLAYVVMRKR
jgi:di/tricarboxylate transporter